MPGFIHIFINVATSEEDVEEENQTEAKQAALRGVSQYFQYITFPPAGTTRTLHWTTEGRGGAIYIDNDLIDVSSKTSTEVPVGSKVEVYDISVKFENH